MNQDLTWTAAPRIAWKAPSKHKETSSGPTCFPQVLPCHRLNPAGVVVVVVEILVPAVLPGATHLRGTVAFMRLLFADYSNSNNININNDVYIDYITIKK